MDIFFPYRVGNFGNTSAAGSGSCPNATVKVLVDGRPSRGAITKLLREPRPSSQAYAEPMEERAGLQQVIVVVPGPRWWSARSCSDTSRFNKKIPPRCWSRSTRSRISSKLADTSLRNLS
jgi:hypothetical protein